MNIKKLDKNDCTGCFSCVYSCPQKCIDIKEDDEGFRYPYVNETQCINCGVCIRKCPILNKVQKHSPVSVWAGQNKDIRKVRSSSSGGIGFLSANRIISEEGIVYGCELTENLKVVHSRITSLENVSRLSKSKYVQSNIESVYKDIVSDCRTGRKILFIGTPCQVAAIRRYTGDKYDNLFTIDLVCHGVPNQKLFDKYIEYIKQKDKDLIYYDFRNKEKYSWLSGATIAKRLRNKTKYCSQHTDPYGSSFFWMENLRYCCYNCNFSTRDRVGDLTICDYWGVDSIGVDFEGNYQDGMSAIFCNTDKGSQLFDTIKEHLYYFKTDFKSVLANNPNLKEASHMPEIRKDFYIKLNSKGYGWVAKRMYLKTDYWYFLVKGLAPEKVKLIIKNIIRKLK